MARYGKKAAAKVAKALHERKRGTLKSGGSGKTVKSRKQAIAIGLSEARRAGGKVPKKKTTAKKRASTKKTATRKAASRRAPTKSSRKTAAKRGPSKASRKLTAKRAPRKRAMKSAGKRAPSKAAKSKRRTSTARKRPARRGR